MLVHARVRLSVVVVNWNSRDDVLACLASLAAQTHDDLEVVVVDNASTDGSAAAIRAAYPGVTLLEERHNWGFAEGCNRGIARTTGPWIALLNNDAVAEPTWGAELVRAAEAAEPRCGMLQSLMLYAHEPDRINSAGIELGTEGGGRDRLEHAPRAAGQREEEIFCPTGGACAYRRAMLDAIRLPRGWFDPEHFCYYEDMDLGWRARLAGWSARYVPSSVVVHRYHGTTSRKGRAWLRKMAATNRVRTLAKNASPAFLLRTAPFTAYDVARMAWVCRGGGLVDLGRAVVHAAALRRRVDAIATVDRREVERTWARDERRRR